MLVLVVGLQGVLWAQLVLGTVLVVKASVQCP
jgi:hypothetical protein